MRKTEPGRHTPHYHDGCVHGGYAREDQVPCPPFFPPIAVEPPPIGGRATKRVGSVGTRGRGSKISP